MSEYHKIQSIFKRDMSSKRKKIVERQSAASAGSPLIDQMVDLIREAAPLAWVHNTNGAYEEDAYEWEKWAETLLARYDSGER